MTAEPTHAPSRQQQVPNNLDDELCRRAVWSEAMNNSKHMTAEPTDAPSRQQQAPNGLDDELSRRAVWSEATKNKEAANAGNKFQAGNKRSECNGPSFWI